MAENSSFKVDKNNELVIISEWFKLVLLVGLFLRFPPTNLVVGMVAKMGMQHHTTYIHTPDGCLVI